MNTTQLKYALEIESARSITAAAQNLYLSQPNLSKAINELEKEIGMKIFIRTAKGVQPTREGKEFLTNARVIYEQIKNFDEMYTREKADEVRLTLCIPRATYVSMAFTDFLNTIVDRERIMINIRERSSSETINYVASGEAQLGMIRYQESHDAYVFSMLRERGIEAIKLLEFEPVIVMSAKHPLAEKDEVSTEELSEYIELIHGDIDSDYMESRHIERGTLNATSKKRIFLYERGSQGDILANVHGTYMWVSNMPESILRAGNLVLKRCSDQKIKNRDLLIYRKGHLFSQDEKKFLECIRQRIETLQLPE